jgi:DNA-binding transcriptional LysR family regulator
VGDGQRWLGVEFRHLGALAAVAREGSFRRAAESLGYVQSAISSQIAHLERVIGTQLVERSSGTAGTTLTVAGRVLLGHVEEILARFEAAHIDVRALADGTDVEVRLGVIDGVGPRRLPGILRSFSERFPDARVRIYESYSDEQNFTRIARGELDLMITELPLPDGPFEYSLLERDRYVLLVDSRSPLAMQATPPDAVQLAAQPLLMPAPSRSEDSLLIALRETGIQQEPSLRPLSIAALQAAVAAGLGVGVAPALAVNPDDPQTVTIEAPDLLPERLLALVRHRVREYSPSVRGFIEIVTETFDELRAR